jgi:hypothetical protein
MRTRYAFAGAFLACFGVTGLVYNLLDPAAQARFVAWASTNVANLEHEPLLPLLLSAFVAPGYLVTWPVLIVLAMFGANRALGNGRLALVCLAGHVIGTLVSEGIVAYRVDAGQLSAASRHLTDVGPSYVVVTAVVVALAFGTWLARALAAVDLVILVFPGAIFGGLSQLDVAAVGHLTAMLTAAVLVGVIMLRRRNTPHPPRGTLHPRNTPHPPRGTLHPPRGSSASGGDVAHGRADAVGDRSRGGPEDQLADRAAPERAVGQPGHHPPAGHGGDGGEPERDG